MIDTDNARREVVEASRILVGEAIFDGFDHVSRRHPERLDRFLISLSLAPALLTPREVLEIDLEGNAVSEPEARLFLERIIHSEIYRRLPDVHAIVHSHVPSVLPFTVVPSVRVRPLCHMCGFMYREPGTFDVADLASPSSDMLIRNAGLGAAIAHVRWPAHRSSTVLGPAGVSSSPSVGAVVASSGLSI
jgi:HCOMODA/2-hydroxy-3-carboxy-muconic semialdehyde decarboxylase